LREESPAHIEKRHLKESKELSKRLVELNRPKPKLYVFYLFLIVCLAYVIDEIASVVTIQIQANIVTEFFVDGMAMNYGQGLSSYQAFCYVILPFLALGFFYKPLADKYGRKPFLVINTLFLGAGMFIVYSSNNFFTYMVGLTFIEFFVMHDIHNVYIMEVSDPKRRGTTFGVTKFFAVLGTLLIPLSKLLFMNDGDHRSWHNILLIPAICGLVVSFLALLFARETDPFLKERIAYLSMSDEERRAQKSRDKEAGAQGGLINATKLCFHHRQLFWILVAAGCFYVASVVTSNYSGVMKECAKMSENDITIALFAYPIGNAFMQLFSGLLSDAKGRKPMVVTMSSLAILFYVLFTCSAIYGWNPIIVGLSIGGFVGSYWSAGDTIGGIMLGESVPTNLRSSVATVQTFVFAIFGNLGTLFFIIVQPYVSLSILPWLYLIWAAPGMVFAILVLILKVGETKGVDIEDITGGEWDQRNPGSLEERTKTID